MKTQSTLHAYMLKYNLYSDKKTNLYTLHA